MAAERHPPRLVVLALEHANLAAALKATKASEMVKRLELVEACFPAGLVMGTNTAVLAGGYMLKAVVSPNPKVTDIAVLQMAITKLSALGEAGMLIASRLVNWVPEIRIGEHKKLDARMRKIIDKAIVIDKSSPSVTLVEPG